LVGHQGTEKRKARSRENQFDRPAGGYSAGFCLTLVRFTQLETTASTYLTGTRIAIG